MDEHETIRIVHNTETALNALRELNRIDVTDLDSDDVEAYTKAVEGVSELTDKDVKRTNARLINVDEFNLNSSGGENES